MPKPKRPISEANLKNWQAAFDRWAERDAREWAANPNNPNLAQGIWGQGSKRLPDAERKHVSPLNGVAKPMERK